MRLGKHSRACAACWVWIVVAGGTVPALAKTVYVSPTGNNANDGLTWETAKLTVQEGLNTAVADDQVWVAAGTYIENITLKLGVALYGGFAGGETELAQRNWVTNKTILDGNRAGSVVTSPAGATGTTRIVGFTIRNGNGTLSGADRYGGGIYCSSSSPAIVGNTVAGNAASEGGGIYCSAFSTPAIFNNAISGNSALYRGGGISCYSASPTIVNNTICGNTGPDHGGGLYCYSSSPTIANTIIAFNSSGMHGVGGSPVLRCNCVYANAAYNYSGITEPTGINGNLLADPGISGWRYGHSHIRADSPCVGAGDNGSVPLDTQDLDGDGDRTELLPFDLDGQPRIQGPNAVVDIGADESDGSDPSADPNVVVRVSRDGDDAHDGSTWALAKRTVQAGINAASASGGEVWVKAGTYPERISLCAFVHAYGGFDGTEASRYERDLRFNVTILDGEQGGSVVTIQSAGYRVNTVDGFTITNGEADSSGGGICCDRSSPTIANNTVSGNSASEGGGIHCRFSNPTIADNTITRNNASSRGAGIFCVFSDSMITNNTINGNTAIYDGGGIFCGSSSATITNNTITGNSAESGGGICCSASSPTVVNTVVAFNSSGILKTGSGAPILRYNCVCGNVAYNYSGISDATGTNGNISADPKLGNLAYGNTHIQPDSPCKDAGDDVAVEADWLDIDGQARIQGSRVDIGADESDGMLWPAGPCVIVRVSPEGDDMNDGSSWALAKRTVQAGIDAASALGGEVWVQAGVYLERITLLPYAHLYGGFAGTENVRVERDWITSATILDAQQSGSVVAGRVAHQGLGTIDGFTIRNGSAAGGGGIYCSASSPTIANNMITGNGASSLGGGISCAGSSRPIIVSNTITGNSRIGIYCNFSSPMIANNTIAQNSEGGIYCTNSSSPEITHNVIERHSLGSGITCSYYSSPLIANNTIRGNTASGYGGGIRCANNCSPTIANNAIIGNISSGSVAKGGGIYCASSSPMIANNTISANIATYVGGGIYCFSSSPTIVNNAIAKNAASTGGGIYCFENSSATIVNNTVIANSAYTGAGIHCESSSPTIVNTIVAFNSSGVCKAGSGILILKCNCVYQNVGYDYSGVLDPTGVDGNISIDPGVAGWKFGNWHVRPGSPCVGAGDNASVPLDTRDLDGDGDTIKPLPFDLDGQPRIRGLNGTVDIGADESDGTDPPAGPNVIVRVSPDGDDVNDGSAWTLTKRTVQAGIDAASVLGGEVWVRAGEYPERITLHACAHVYAGFRGTEHTRDQRDFRSNLTILDGQQGGSVVTVPPAGYAVNTLDGFTIRNGNASSGGGFFCTSSSPMISNNTIAGNSASVYGGGIYCTAYASSVSSPTIVNNTITGNSPNGIWCSYSSPTIANNTIIRNVARGISCVESFPLIINNAITGNSGGGIACSGSATIANNAIAGNSVSSSTSSVAGGGIWCSGSAVLVNNTITGNSASSPYYTCGGGIYCGGSTTVTHNTITKNTASNDGGAIYCPSGTTIANTVVALNSSGIYRTGTDTSSLRYNCVYGNAAYNYGGVTDPTGTNGSISSDPLFVRQASSGSDGQWGTADDDYGDLRLQHGSPCIDAGDNAAVPADISDLDGDGDVTEPIPFDLAGMARFFDDLLTPDTGLGTPPIVDMGAYEYVPVPALQLSVPATGQSLWRNQKNIIRLTFDADIVAPDVGAVMIQEMLAGGTYGDDLSAGFAFTVENDGQGQPRVLKIRETGTSLAHRKWYAVRNTGAWTGVAPFTVQYVVQVGDASNDGRVLNTDFGWVNAAIPTFSTADDDRRDMNGDGRILNTDFGVLNSKIPSFPVAKPSGH